MKPLLCRIKYFLARLLRVLPGSSEQWGPPRKAVLTAQAWSEKLPPEKKAKQRYIPIEGMREVMRRPVAFLDPGIQKRFEAMQNAVIAPEFVLDLRPGRYWGRAYGYILDDADTLIVEASPQFKDFGRVPSCAASHDGLHCLNLPKMQVWDKTVLALNTLFCDNFHHWLIDTLPKINLVQAAGICIEEIDAFIFDYKGYKYQDEALDLLGIDKNKVVASRQDMHIKAKRLIVPSYSEIGGRPETHNYTPRGIAFLRDLFLTKNRPKPRDWPTCIFVSRAKTRCRRILQEDALFGLLEPLGFEKIALEDFSLVEQAHFFNHAKCIVMPHGGGIANTLFCEGGTIVFEIFATHYIPTCLITIANDLGLHYYGIEGAPVPGGDILYSLADISINPKRIYELVERALKKHR